MIQFVWPWLLVLIPLPLIIRRFVPGLPQARLAALRVPFLQDFGGGQPQTVSSGQRKPLLWALLAWLCLILAAARPQWLSEPLEIAVSGRDLMLAVDVSGSMHEQDFFIENRRVDRLTAIKYVASGFIERRTGDRLGLILFGTQAYLHVPLTFDRKTVRTMLNEAFIGITEDDPQTSIGDAIGLAVKRLRQQADHSRVLILLTDGANTAGELAPLKAAELAAQEHLKIYTIGMGADEMVVRSLFGAQRVNPSADLDEKTLTNIAGETGGRYFRARDSQELEQIYALLDQLEPVEKDKQYFRPARDLFHWPLAATLSICAGLALYRLKQT